jgi:transposase-like protein
VARPPRGSRQVGRLEGEAQAKERLRIVLETIAGQRSVVEACRRLGVGKTRFHALRQQALQAALDGLEPGMSGRPRARDGQEPARVRELQDQVEGLKLDLQAALVRTELALTLPNVLRRTLLRDGKKNGRAKSG